MNAYALNRIPRKQITWVVKLSKFCNMRCAYCYEWDELSKRSRLPISIWQQLMISIKEFHEIQKKRRPNIITRVVLHGGEPLTLPIEYLEEIMNLFDTTFEQNNEFVLGLQTNLYSLSKEKLELITNRRLSIGVSLDVVPGVRVSAAGQETEAKVINNIERLQSCGVQIGAITVLAKHTCREICHIHDFFADRHIPWRILPLFDGPDSRLVDKFSVSHNDLIHALRKLFIHWFENGVRIPVAPLMEYFENTLLKMLGFHSRFYDRRQQGDGVFVVNTDGRLYSIIDAYQPSLALGNIAQQSIHEILNSEQYKASLDRDDVQRSRYCYNCEYHGACNGWPIFACRQTGDFNGRCPLDYQIHLFMEKYLIQYGFNESSLRQILLSLLNDGTDLSVTQQSNSVAL